MKRIKKQKAQKNEQAMLPFIYAWANPNSVRFHTCGPGRNYDIIRKQNILRAHALLAGRASFPTCRNINSHIDRSVSIRKEASKRY